MKFIYGRNPVFELVKANPGRVHKIMIAENNQGENISRIIDIARAKHLKIEFTNRRKLDSVTNRKVHQGVLAFTNEDTSYELEDLLRIPEEKQEKAFLVMLDSIYDPQNLGSILRTAEAAGAHGVIIPKHRACKVTPTVVKVSAGATEYIPVVEVTNIVNCIMSLKEKGIFVIGADNSAKENYLNVDMNKDVAIVIGNEDEGIRRLTKEKCDLLVKIPMKGRMESLNTSVAASILIYEVFRSRINNSA